MNDGMVHTYSCAVCGQPNETMIDPLAGVRQVFTEDCAVCCRPNVLKVLTNPETLEVSIEVEFEG